MSNIHSLTCALRYECTFPRPSDPHYQNEYCVGRSITYSGKRQQVFDMLIDVLRHISKQFEKQEEGYVDLDVLAGFIPEGGTQEYRRVA